MPQGLLRSQFPILRSRTYLNTCSLGPFSKSAERRVQQFQGEWSRQGAPSWYGTWWDRLELTRSTFAKLIGATTGEVALMPNVSTALNVVGSALDYRVRPHVVTTALDFPTISYAWTGRPQVRLRRIGRADDVSVPRAAYEQALDETTAAVATCHVFYATGALQDVKGIASLARKAGAVSIIDAYHSAGQVPIDVRDLGCDVVITGGLKWLLGGPGCALLFVRKTLLSELEPRMAGWFGNEHQFDFDPERFSFRPTAARFELGTPSLPSVFATLGGMELVRRVGPARIRRRQNALVTDLYEKLVDRGYRVHSPEREAERAGILMVEVPYAPHVVERLARRRIVVDHRGGRLRVSPYFFNSEADNDAFVRALRAVARPRAMRARSPAARDRALTAAPLPRA